MYLALRSYFNITILGSKRCLLHLPYVDNSQVKWSKQEPLVMLLVIVGEKCFTCFVAARTSP